MRLLVSVRNLGEARLAARAGVDFIDLKDPAAGALGALPPARIAEIVAALRAPQAGRPPALSATTGDLPSDALDAILAQVSAVAATGVDYVKVGIDGAPASRRLLGALAACDAPVVPVLLADHGIDASLVHEALALESFAALMLDTADKGAGSLLERLPEAALAAFITTVRQARGGSVGANVFSGASPRSRATVRAPLMSGLAGALRLADLPALRRLQPDFAGFRSAVCGTGRAGPLDPARLAALCDPAARAALVSGAVRV